jgi:hypothetical protein
MELKSPAQDRYATDMEDKREAGTVSGASFLTILSQQLLQLPTSLLAALHCLSANPVNLMSMF